MHSCYGDAHVHRSPAYFPPRYAHPRQFSDNITRLSVFNVSNTFGTMSSSSRGAGSTSSRRGTVRHRGLKRSRHSSAPTRPAGSDDSSTPRPLQGITGQAPTSTIQTSTRSGAAAADTLSQPTNNQEQHSSVTMEQFARLQVELTEVKAELDAALVAVNDYKEKYNTMEQQFHHEKLTNKILVVKVKNCEEEIINIKQERDGLTRLNKELKETVGPKQNHRYKFMDRLMGTLDDKFVPLALIVDSKILRWAQAETMEIKCAVEDTKQRQWEGRMVKVSEHGIKYGDDSSNFGYLYIPTLVPEVISCLDVFYIRSFSSIENVLAQLTKEVLEQEEWSGFNSNQTQASNAIASISTDKTMVSRVKQSLSDSISNRKRAVRDELFCLLKYFSLKSSHDRRKDKPLFSKQEEILKAQSKLLQIGSDGQINLSTWRTKVIQDLTSDSSVHPILDGRDFRHDDPVQYEDDREITEQDKSYCYTSLGIFRNNISFNIWILFLGYNPYEDEDNVTEVSFFNIPRLDAWIATTIQLLEISEQRGGGRQKHYNNTFAQNMKLATFSLIDQIYHFAKYWLPDELTVPTTVPGDDFKYHILNSVQREGTIVLHSERNKTYYIALTSGWFTSYISQNCGVIRDCFVAMVSRDWKNIIPITKDNNGILPNDNSAGANIEVQYEEDEEDEEHPPLPPLPPEGSHDTPAPMHVDPLPESSNPASN